MNKKYQRLLPESAMLLVCTEAMVLNAGCVVNQSGNFVAIDTMSTEFGVDLSRAVASYSVSESC